jgi:Rrf2 family protein
MLGKTSVLAIRVLIHLGERQAGLCVSPRRLADDLGESPTYLAKVCRLLVKAGILRAHKGALGGVALSRPAAEVTLLSMVEACQGTITGDYCFGRLEPEEVCSFHRAAVELHEAVTGVLARWNLARLLERPRPTHSFSSEIHCHLANRRTK